MPSNRRRLERLERQQDRRQRESATITLAVVDASGNVIGGPFAGQHHTTLPNRRRIAVIGGVDMDVILGRKLTGA